MGFINEDFIEWLHAEMALRQWNQTDLAKAAHLSPNSISSVLNGMRGPGAEFCTGIARALNLPFSFVYVKAGLMPAEKKEVSTILAEIMSKTSSLPIEKQEIILDIVNGLKIKQERDSKRKNGPPEP